MKGFIVGILLYAATLPLGMPEAKAMTCTADKDVSICMDYQYLDGDGNQVWKVVVTNQYTTERMDVTCDDARMVAWESVGGATQSEADAFARAFCAL